jgi:hypothetical protein
MHDKWLPAFIPVSAKASLRKSDATLKSNQDEFFDGIANSLVGLLFNNVHDFAARQVEEIWMVDAASYVNEYFFQGKTQGFYPIFKGVVPGFSHILFNIETPHLPVI